MNFRLYNEQKIKFEIEKNLCQFHGKHPIIIPLNSSFKIISCCKEFGDYIQSELEKITQQEINISISQHVEEYLKDS